MILKAGRKNAYLTVYLSLIFPLVMSLILMLLQGARISAVKLKTEIAADISMNAVLSEYNRELMKQYDLFFVDMSYGTSCPSIANTQAHLRDYLRKNLEMSDGSLSRDFLGTKLSGADIIEYSLASDDDGDVLRRQIGDYLHFTLEGRIEEALPSGIDALLSSGLMDVDIASKRAVNQATIDSIELPEEETEEGEVRQVTLDNPADVANGLRGSGVLGLVLPGTSSISRTKVSLADYISNRSIPKGNGTPAEVKSISKPCNEVMFHKYVFEKLGFYGAELEKSVLKYQVEYLVAGKNRDYDNLESVCKKLLMIREAANVAYIFTDAAKMEEATAWAATLSAVILVPELLEPVKISLLFAWAFLESLQDIRILLEGGKVPLGKTSANWHTKLRDILNIKGSLRSISSTSGLSYKDYLYGILYSVGKKKKTFRTMDIMEMDVRKTPGNAAFRMDGCVDTYMAKIYTESYFGPTTQLQRRYGYYFVR